jgi:hypothetical protein
LRIWHYYFSRFVFYGVIRPHDLCHEFWRLDRFGFDLFKSFFIFYFLF